MDVRTALLPGTLLSFPGMTCTVEHEVGRGSNAIVYEGYYLDQTSRQRHRVLVKELYPYLPGGGVTREEDLSLRLTEEAYGGWDVHRLSFLKGNEAHLALLARHPERIGANLNTFLLNGTLYTVLGAMWPRTHKFTTSTTLIGTLQQDAADVGVEVYTETAAKSLIVGEDGSIVGVNAEKADGTKVIINAKAVVLACGGYGANAPMAKEYDNYWGENLSDSTLTTNVGTNTGDGIVMAQAVGAGVTGMEVVQLMPSSSPIKGTMTDGIWGDASEQIWINGEGKRFVNEYAERDVLASASLALDNGIFYIIYAGPVDPETGMCEGTSMDASLFGTGVQSMVDNGHIWYGSTLAELAEASATQAGGAAPAFKEEVLRETIEKYNSYVDAQEDPDFGKGLISGKIDLEAIEANPEVGLTISPRKPAIHHTMGGITINTNAEVLDTEGNVIPGLYAAGEVTGGIHAGNRLGGNAVADIFTYGHISGGNAATYVAGK